MKPIPWNHLGVRFVLELALIAGVAYWGWRIGDGGPLGLVLAILFPTLLGALWGVFGTPNDGSRGAPVIPISGKLRLLLEALIIGVATYGVWTSWSRAAAETLLTAFVIHYALTWERSRWLWRAPAHPKRE
jgi:hypothetical protein